VNLYTIYWLKRDHHLLFEMYSVEKNLSDFGMRNSVPCLMEINDVVKPSHLSNALVPCIAIILLSCIVFDGFPYSPLKTLEQFDLWTNVVIVVGTTLLSEYFLDLKIWIDCRLTFLSILMLVLLFAHFFC
jgi:hypothetical protein